MKDGTWSTNFAENQHRWFPTLEKATERSFYRLENVSHTWQRQPVAIHIGAGPSLDRSLADLRKLCLSPQNTPTSHRQAILFATDGALKPLLEAGIKPHFVSILDENEATERFFSGIRAGNMTLLASATAYHEALLAWEAANHRDPNSVYFWCNANENTWHQRRLFGFTAEYIPWFPWLRGLTNSVAMMSLAGAQRMGIRSHFLVGCDFGVQTLEDGTVKTHCDGFAVDQTAYRQDWFYDRADYVKRVTDAMAGHAARIDSTRMIDRYPIYNCTEGRGALKRVTYMPLLEAADRFRFLRAERPAKVAV